ncbi:MAG: hypothetical protein ACOYOA_09495 [Saprospiraceae bacterium]
MSASNLKDKNQAFHRLLHDLHQDSMHSDMEDERDFLPKISQSSAMSDLRGRLKKRYRRSRVSPTLMYLPRIALTMAILLTCAVAYLYIRRLKEIEILEMRKNNEQLHQIDSLIREKMHHDTIK